MIYSAQQIDGMEEALGQWLRRGRDVTFRLAAHRWREAQGREFALHGLARRLSDLIHAADRLFDTLPPDATMPDRDMRMDATAFLHSFVINCYGTIDNLAHVWVLEAGVRDASGGALARARIGLGAHPKYRAVMDSLSTALRDKVHANAEWLTYMTDYRHALAHRIPPYIPPRRWTDAHREEWEALDREIVDAIHRQDFDRCERLRAEQDRLGVFDPVFMHSFGENARPMQLHSQIVCDLATVVDLTETLMLAVERLPRR